MMLKLGVSPELGECGDGVCDLCLAVDARQVNSFSWQFVIAEKSYLLGGCNIFLVCLQF